MKKKIEIDNNVDKKKEIDNNGKKRKYTIMKLMQLIN